MYVSQAMTTQQANCGETTLLHRITCLSIQHYYNLISSILLNNCLNQEGLRAWVYMYHCGWGHHMYWGHTCHHTCFFSLYMYILGTHKQHKFGKAWEKLLQATSWEEVVALKRALGWWCVDGTPLRHARHGYGGPAGCPWA